MSNTVIGLIDMAILLALLMLGMNVGYTMLLCGFIGFALITGIAPALANVGIITFDKINDYYFSVLPLFMLMGVFVSEGGLGKDAYNMARAWFGKFKGGLAIATIGACAIFAAICANSLAGSLVMGKVAYPEMRRSGYKMPLAAGVVSVGGTLGILIPPSMGFIMIGILTNLSIGKLFIAGILPGFLVTFFYVTTIFVWCKFDPKVAPAAALSITWRDRFRSIGNTWAVILLFLLVMGGIYGGLFTATEAGAVGAGGALIISLAKRQMTGATFWSSLVEVAKMSAMIIIMLAGAFVFNGFIAVTQIPNTFGEFLVNLPLSRWVIMALIIVFYIVCGMMFDAISILILTISIFFPAAQAMGFDLVWYSVIMVRLIEMGQISPPYGINLFGLNGVIDAPLSQIYRGVIPFLLSDILNIVVLCLFPMICTFLPEMM
ncbi:MAG: TRAP transporter large permease subunit [Dehalococcoidales bacterium]|nr:TRAP transporter large permease subunit [Dehalococcoidales bacterium]